MDFGIGYFQTLARYNQWANARLYGACLALPEEAYARDRKAFFTSIGGTLNHIIVADQLWLARFRGERTGKVELGATLYPLREGLWAARQREDEGIVTLFDSYEEARLATPFQYTDTEDLPRTLPAPLAFGHFFNHQTHHRGQVHNMLSQDGLEPPELDFLYFNLERQAV